METPADRIKKLLKQWYKEFAKKKYAIPAVVALSCAVYYVVVTTLTVICFSQLITPLVLLGLLWSIGVKRVRKLLLVGAIATLFYAMILTTVMVGLLQHIDPIVAESADGRVTGSVDPLFGDKDTVFTYKLTVNLTGSNLTVTGANVIIRGTEVMNTDDVNHTMIAETPYEYNGTRLYNFTLGTTTSKPINQYYFRVNFNGTWVWAGKTDSLNNLYWVEGPVFKDSLAVASALIISFTYLNYLYVFIPYAIICGMIWWTRRARRMREKQIEKWQAEQAKEEAEKPKTSSKVPSLDAAMGKVDEGFVCSECGADVPSDATVCPKCGEKFE